MTKAPRAGRVKTRLTPWLTAEEAAALNQAFLRDIAGAISAVGEGSMGIGCYTPVGAEDSYGEIFPATFKLIAQRGGDLDKRLTCATQDLLAVGFSAVCLIGSDSPTVPATIFAEAVRVLSTPSEVVVIGPSHDGGYYLIGLKAVQRRLFEQIEWSTSRVLEQTMARAAEIGLPVHLLPTAYDVDDKANLRRLCDDLLDPHSGLKESIAPATRKFLQELVNADTGRTMRWSGRRL